MNESNQELGHRIYSTLVIVSVFLNIYCGDMLNSYCLKNLNQHNLIFQFSEFIFSCLLEFKEDIVTSSTIELFFLGIKKLY